MTVPLAPIRTRPPSGGAPDGRGDGGLITLEWLLIVGAVAGFAATTVLAVQRVVDDAAEIPDDPAVRFIDAEIAAAAIGAEATAWRRGLPDDPLWQADFRTGIPSNPGAYILPARWSYDPFEDRCTAIDADFGDVVGSAHWIEPRELGFGHPWDTPPWDIVTGADLEAALLRGEIERAARCEVAPR